MACTFAQPCGAWRQLDIVLTEVRGIDVYRCMNGHSLTPPPPVEIDVPVVRKRDVPPIDPSVKENEMRTCKGCGAPGRRRDSCPTCSKKDQPATPEKPAPTKATKPVKKTPPRPKPRPKKKPATTRRPAPKREGLPSFEAALTFLDTQIEGAKARLAKLEAARDGMAMLVEASR